MSGGRHRDVLRLERERPFAHRVSWADPLRDLIADADLVAVVPSSTPVATVRLLDTLGVVVEHDPEATVMRVMHT